MHTKLDRLYRRASDDSSLLKFHAAKRKRRRDMVCSMVARDKDGRLLMDGKGLLGGRLLP